MAVALLLSACGAHESGRFSRDELNGLKDAALAARVLGEAGAPFTHALRQGDDLSPGLIFTTDLRANESVDLCEATLLWVQFAKASDRPGTADVPSYVVTSVATQDWFLAPNRPLKRAEELWLNDHGKRQRECAAMGPAISANHLRPDLVKVWGKLAAGGTAGDAAFALRVLRAARRDVQAANFSPSSCTDNAAEHGPGICGEPAKAIVGLFARHDPRIERCEHDPRRACVEIQGDRDSQGAATTIHLETDTADSDALPAKPSVTRIDVERRPVHVL